jgi:formylglycine-generating enzyme required for sulfatase activity
VRLGGAAPQLLTPRFLADELARARQQYEELRRQHEAFRKALASAERIAELEKSAPEARELADRLKDSLVRVDRLEKQLAALTALTAPQQAASEMLARVKKVGGIDLVRIPAGEFYMGSENKVGFYDEQPRHKVTIAKPFYLGKTEVTVGQFKRFVQATGHQTEAEKAGGKNTWKAPRFEQTDDHPVVYVSWNDAVAYCGWLAKETGAKVRLPREAEWEYSCRAGAATKFCFGDDEEGLGQYAWYTKNTGDKGTRACGLKLPNAFGLYDMHGNAWEWCLDGQRHYQDRAEIDPEGPTAGANRVIRGGSFDDNPLNCHASARKAREPSVSHVFLGFRVLVVP